MSSGQQKTANLGPVLKRNACVPCSQIIGLDLGCGIIDWPWATAPAGLVRRRVVLAMMPTRATTLNTTSASPLSIRVFWVAWYLNFASFYTEKVK